MHIMVREGIYAMMVSNLFERMNVCLRVELLGSEVQNKCVCRSAPLKQLSSASHIESSRSRSVFQVANASNRTLCKMEES